MLKNKMEILTYAPDQGKLLSINKEEIQKKDQPKCTSKMPEVL